MRSIKLAVITAAFALSAVPAFAGPPAGVPGAAHANSHSAVAVQDGSDDGVTVTEARGLGRTACAEFKRNFADNRSQFGKCISAAARVVRTHKRPGRTCNEAGLSHRKTGDERRSDFSACVIAAAHAEEQAEEPVEEPVEEEPVEDPVDDGGDDTDGSEVG